MGGLSTEIGLRFSFGDPLRRGLRTRRRRRRRAPPRSLRPRAPNSHSQMVSRGSFASMDFCGGEEDAQDAWRDKWEAHRRSSVDETRSPHQPARRGRGQRAVVHPRAPRSGRPGPQRESGRPLRERRPHERVVVGGVHAVEAVAGFRPEGARFGRRGRVFAPAGGRPAVQILRRVVSAGSGGRLRQSMRDDV